MNKLLLRDKIKLIKDNNVSVQIFEILKQDNNFSYSIKNKGLIFDINLLSDTTINKINEIINNNNTNNKIKYTSYYLDKFDNDIIDNSIKRDINISKLKMIQRNI